jgi:lysophospholipase L1-like esterase
MKSYRLHCLFFSLIGIAFAGNFLTVARAQEQPRIPASLDLEDGDTMVFLGDSITHQCLYTQYVENFFHTRYPERRIHFHNAGVSGDRAADALARFDDDVAAFQPKYVTILLGMNDGSYEDYQPDTFAS